MATDPQRASPASAPGDRPGRATDWVGVPRGEVLLVVPVAGGVCDLSRVGALRGRTRELFEELWSAASGGAASLGPRAVALLLARGAPREVAERDARSLLEALERGGASEGEAWTVEADDLVTLARAVLAAGHALAFQARGRSMRPFLPHGSLLRVEARPAAALGRGAVVLYEGESQRLVAHRVIGREGERLVMRGDSSPRRELVAPERVLGLVVSAERPGDDGPVEVSSGPRRLLGLACGSLWALASALAGAAVIRPLRGTYGGPSAVRRAARVALRLVSGALLRLERLARRARAPLDALRAALTASAEKDEERRALYARRAVQRFTSLDENLAAGLTLLEEVLLARHGIGAARTLVVGCGPGRECLALARRGHEVVGLDREPGLLAEARALAERAGLEIRFVEGEAHDFRVDGPPFELVVVFSGLYDMLLPRERRLALLRCAARHLVPGGRVALTFLAAYAPPGLPPAPRVRTFLEALSPDHEDGDLFLLNECVHVFPRVEDVAEEARAAGFEVEALERDQRAYDRFEGRVKGYAVLRLPRGGDAAR